MKKILNVVGSYWSPSKTLIPISSAMISVDMGDQRVKFYYDWYVFGIRVVRHQINHFNLTGLKS